MSGLRAEKDYMGVVRRKSVGLLGCVKIAVAWRALNFCGVLQTALLQSCPAAVARALLLWTSTNWLGWSISLTNMEQELESSTYFLTQSLYTLQQLGNSTHLAFIKYAKKV
ncbi:hypothetical protein SUGI_0224080 [Cryptomeria japonica]|nr:hypothetical protein SUGI_0224080 [Cryptomeria japonica]